MLESLPTEVVARHQPYWAVKAHLLAELKRREAADAAYGRAIGSCSDPAVRAWLTRRRALLAERGS
mgnify:CR=1 FL=1